MVGLEMSEKLEFFLNSRDRAKSHAPNPKSAAPNDLLQPLFNGCWEPGRKGSIQESGNAAFINCPFQQESLKHKHDTNHSSTKRPD